MYCNKMFVSHSQELAIQGYLISGEEQLRLLDSIRFYCKFSYRIHFLKFKLKFDKRLVE